jgi:hypothetical protein
MTLACQSNTEEKGWSTSLDTELIIFSADLQMSTSMRAKTTVNFSQSQAVAQNMLCASMCEILWKRKLLPEECFE